MNFNNFESELAFANPIFLKLGPKLILRFSGLGPGSQVGVGVTGYAYFLRVYVTMRNRESGCVTDLRNHALTGTFFLSPSVSGNRPRLRFCITGNRPWLRSCVTERNRKLTFFGKRRPLIPGIWSLLKSHFNYIICNYFRRVMINQSFWVTANKVYHKMDRLVSLQLPNGPVPCWHVPLWDALLPDPDRLHKLASSSNPKIFESSNVKISWGETVLVCHVTVAYCDCNNNWLLPQRTFMVTGTL